MFIMEATKMPEILQDLSWAISQLIYSLMPNVYAIFEYFAKEEFFSSTEIANFWNNLYILLSVLVLFAIGIKLLSSIVNPDVLDKGKGDNKKKSAKQSFIDAIIAVFLVILVPIVFGILNDVQREVIESNFIPEYILGKSINISSEANVGQVLAYETLSSFLQPCSNEENPDNCNSEAGVYDMQTLSYSIKDIKTIKNEWLSTTSWWDGKITDNHLDYQPILAPVAGGMILYQLVLMALDMALRAVKIAFLEIMTPIILGAYIFNRDIFTRWVKEFIATYIGAFLKIMIVTLLVIGLSKFDYINSSDFAKDTNFNNTTIGILKLVLIMGILRLVKEVPNLINKIFGTNIQPQGGIRGRLGQMAGVGNLAQRAWDTLRTHPIQTTRRLVSAPISAVGGAVSHGAAAFGRARGQWQNGQRGAAIRTGIGGFFGMGGAALRSGQQGWRNGNLQGIGAAYNTYEDRHPRDASFLGTLGERVRMGTGFRNSIEQEAENDKVVNFRDRAGNTQRRVTIEQLQREQKQMNEALARRNAIFEAAEKEVERSDSNVGLNVHAGAHNFNGSHAQIREQIETLRANGGITDADASTALRELEIERQNAIHDVCTTVLSGGNQMQGNRILAGTTGDIHGPTLGTITTNRDVMNNSLAQLIAGANLVDNNGNALNITNINDWANLDALNVSLWRNTNDINYNLQLHDQEIANRNNTDAHRRREANASAATAHRNNGGGGGNAGGGH